MKVLLLEDKAEKREKIRTAILDHNPEISITSVSNWCDYIRQINSVQFDLILLDVMVPRSAMDASVSDHREILAETTRSLDSKSFLTPALVITEYLKDSEPEFLTLNQYDIGILSFDHEEKWKSALTRKLDTAAPKVTFDFVIVCALTKEANAYEPLVDFYGKLETVGDLLCRRIDIKGQRGVIVQLNRMGLVSSAVATALAIDRFEPSLVCMSGICGGISSQSKIYDILVSDTCHQHDLGKWSDEGFKSEHYDVQINPILRNKLQEFCADDNFIREVTTQLTPRSSEYPEGFEEISPSIRLCATSSGSAVYAEEGKTASLNNGQRKLAGFDMEVFAVYEASRLSAKHPLFFAVKSVVDDGGANKGDRFHRIGCLLSARFVCESIRRGVSMA